MARKTSHVDGAQGVPCQWCARQPACACTKAACRCSMRCSACAYTSVQRKVSCMCVDGASLRGVQGACQWRGRHPARAKAAACRCSTRRSARTYVSRPHWALSVPVHVGASTQHNLFCKHATRRGCEVSVYVDSARGLLHVH